MKLMKIHIPNGCIVVSDIYRHFKPTYTQLKKRCLKIILEKYEAKIGSIPLTLKRRT